jgi:hypothetical protein
MKPQPKKLEVLGVQCPSCKDLIFSRAAHDFRYCSCEKIAIDGGFDYHKISGDTFNAKFFIINLKSLSVGDLWNDYNYSVNKYGRIKNYSKSKKLPKYISRIKEAPDCFEPKDKGGEKDAPENTVKSQVGEVFSLHQEWAGSDLAHMKYSDIVIEKMHKMFEQVSESAIFNGYKPSEIVLRVDVRAECKQKPD